MSVCAKHSDQPLNMFCATDLELICGFCATIDGHKGHEFCSLEEAYEREKGAFEELLEGVEGWQSADIQSCLETLQSSKKRALLSVNMDAEKVKDYFDKLIGALECKRNEILCDFDTLKLGVMQAYDPEITKLSAALDEQRQALSIAESFRGVSDPLCFLQQMQELRQKLKVLRETPKPSQRDIHVGPLVRNFDVKKWDSLRLREVDKISIPPESSSGRVTGSLVAPRRWIVLLICFLLTASLLLQRHNLTTCVTSQIEPFLTTVSSHIPGDYLTGTYTRLMAAGQECIVNFIDYLTLNTVNFIGS